MTVEDEGGTLPTFFHNQYFAEAEHLGKNPFQRGVLHRLLLNKARRTKNKPFWTFSISFEEAKQYRRKYLNVLTRESQWEEIIVDVYL